MGDEKIVGKANRSDVKTFFRVAGTALTVIVFLISVIINWGPQFVTNLLPSSTFSNEELRNITLYSVIISVSFVLMIFLIYITIWAHNKHIINLGILTNSHSDGLAAYRQTADKIIERIGKKCEKIRSRILNNHNEYYASLIDALKRIEVKREGEIRLTHYIDKVDSDSNVEIAKNYPKKELEICAKLRDSDVNIYKIVTIHNNEKLKKCRDLYDKIINSRLPNYRLAYLDIDPFDTGKLPGVIGVQVIGDEVILIPPETARLSREDGIIHSMYVNCSEFAKNFSTYHLKLWTEIVEYDKKCRNPGQYGDPKDHKGHKGHILFNGWYEGYEKDKDELVNDLWRRLGDKFGLHII